MTGRDQKMTVRMAKEALLPVLAAYNLQLVDIEYVREQQGWVLRIFIDKQGGITLDDCADLSEELGDLFEAKGAIDGPYHLEVSSPGLDRRVRDPLDFERFAGSRIKVKTVAPVGGRKVFSGVLRGMKGDSVAVDVDGATFEIPIGEIEKANLRYDWDANKGKQ
jgi:ribosome maturation factor RimP